LKESTDINCCGLGLGNGFLEMIPKTQATVAK
jgi:hypothetical protein